jgi:hypothetical protein
LAVRNVGRPRLEARVHALGHHGRAAHLVRLDPTRDGRGGVDTGGVPDPHGAEHNHTVA